MAGVTRPYRWRVGRAFSQLGNALLCGDEGEAISSRTGKSIRAGGWAARVPWPSWAYRHWIEAIEDDEGDSAALRRERV